MIIKSHKEEDIPNNTNIYIYILIGWVEGFKKKKMRKY